jgi:predicted dehydrogenase
MSYRIGFVGTGADPDDPDTDGYAMAYRHAAGYERLGDCELVACADIVPENAAAFADAFGIPDRHVYEDYETMLSQADPDIVSICTPPATHADLVIGTARHDTVEGIFCEKPMAETWADSQEMATVCARAEVLLAFNHNMRFGRPYLRVKELIDDGEIGALRRFEFGDSTLYDMGIHLFDLCNYYNDGAAVEWVLAQVDYTEENRMFGTHNENQALAQWRYENGVYGLASTGRGDDFLDPYFRVIGTDGTIEISSGDATVTVYPATGEARTIDTAPDKIYNARPGRLKSGLQLLGARLPFLDGRFEVPSYTERAVEEVVAAVDADRETELGARNALAAQEIVFACWESARRRGRVGLPLAEGGNALTEMVESGELQVEPSQ